MMSDPKAAYIAGFSRYIFNDEPEAVPEPVLLGILMDSPISLPRLLTALMIWFSAS